MPKLAALMRKKYVRNLNQDAGAVTRLRVAARSAAMRQVDENFKTLADDLVAFFAANAGHQSHAAGIVLTAGMIETLRLRSTETPVRCVHGNLFMNEIRCEMLSLAERQNPLAIPAVEIALVSFEKARRNRPCRFWD